MTDCSSCTGTGQVFVACTNPLLTLGRLCYGAVGKEGQSRCPLVQPAPRLLELPVSLTCPPPPSGQLCHKCGSVRLPRYLGSRGRQCVLTTR